MRIIFIQYTEQEKAAKCERIYRMLGIDNEFLLLLGVCNVEKEKANGINDKKKNTNI